jgi:hypothetical protein
MVKNALAAAHHERVDHEARLVHQLALVSVSYEVRAPDDVQAAATLALE